MTKQKIAADWTAFLVAESELPNGDEITFSETNGTTFGLDGFDFDIADNAGAEDSARLPEAKGISRLPDGIVTSAEAAPDYVEAMRSDDGPALDDMLSEEEGAFPPDEEIDKVAAAIVNLDWLDPTQPQDPARLPEKKPIVPQLDDQWGFGERTDGISLVPNVDKDYADAQAAGKGDPVSTLPQDVKQDALAKAARAVHWGVPAREALLELARTAGVGLARAARPMLEADEGLAGKVFVRASAFPGIRKGLWIDKLKQGARGARWVLTDDRTVAERLGMVMASEVPWDEAVAHYLPKLVPLAGGAKLASWPGDPRRTLREAFAAVAAAPVPVPDTGMKPVVVEATEQARVPVRPKEVPVEPLERRVAARKERDALVKIARWVVSGMLSKEDAVRIKLAGGTPDQMIDAAEAVMASPKGASSYGGVGVDAKIPGPVDSPSARKAAANWEERKRLISVLSIMVKKGTLTTDEVDRIVSGGKTNEGIRDLAAAVIRKKAAAARKVAKEPAEYSGPVQKQAVFHKTFSADRQTREVEASLRLKAMAVLEKAVAAKLLSKDAADAIVERSKTAADIKTALEVHLSAPKDAAVYGGPGEGQANAFVPGKAPAKAPDPEVSAIAKAAKAAGVNSKDVVGLLKWARVRMAEGAAGSSLDAALGARFPKKILAAVAPLLGAVRKVHEGASGHFYVDAAAYASPTGTTGCEANASKHRANAIKYVLAMPRCGGCVFANADGVCQQYNKKIASEFPHAELEGRRRRVLALADASDAETTAALFDPKEYNLQSPLAEDIGLDDTVTPKKLGAVLFGGFEIGEEL